MKDLELVRGEQIALHRLAEQINVPTDEFIRFCEKNFSGETEYQWINNGYVTDLNFFNLKRPGLQLEISGFQQLEYLELEECTFKKLIIENCELLTEFYAYDCEIRDLNFGSDTGQFLTNIDLIEISKFSKMSNLELPALDRLKISKNEDFQYDDEYELLHFLPDLEKFVNLSELFLHGLPINELNCSVIDGINDLVELEICGALVKEFNSGCTAGNLTFKDNPELKLIDISRMHQIETLQCVKPANFLEIVTNKSANDQMKGIWIEANTVLMRTEHYDEEV